MANARAVSAHLRPNSAWGAFVRAAPGHPKQSTRGGRAATLIIVVVVHPADWQYAQLHLHSQQLYCGEKLIGTHQPQGSTIRRHLSHYVTFRPDTCSSTSSAVNIASATEGAKPPSCCQFPNQVLLDAAEAHRAPILFAGNKTNSGPLYGHRWQRNAPGAAG